MAPNVIAFVARGYICQFRPHAQHTKESVRSGDRGLSSKLWKNCMARLPHFGQS